MVDSVPVIDFSAYSLDRECPDPERFQQLVDDVHTALTTIGFMYLKNFGIPVQTIKDAFYFSRKFFSLPVEEKIRYVKPVDSVHGYVQIEREGLNPDRRFRDLKETFDCVPLAVSAQQCFPDKELPEFQGAITTFFYAAVPLHQRILEIIARGLKLQDPQFFTDRHKRIGTNLGSSALRTLYYPPLVDVEIKEDQVRCGEHSDYGGITLLFQDSQSGLEVRNIQGTWIPAKPIEGTVVVNIGELMQRWTSDKLIAAKHRVMIPRDQILHQQDRQSIAFFGNPDKGVVIECIDRSEKYPPIETTALLDAKFAETHSKSTEIINY